MNDIERALYQAWHKQYRGRSRAGAVSDALQDAIDAGMSDEAVGAVMDQAARDTEADRERQYRRSIWRREAVRNALTKA